ncbi:peptidoglycan DD-metalloendopeptidase family protein [Roseibacillus persicicus]|uniref:M23 family metallopeptidase n=1 Tax=Roseibacillus persicicus TaxID=454148 RepID=UPI00398B8D89
MRSLLSLALLSILSVSSVHGQRLSLAFPTANDALLRGDLASFYMPTNLASKPPESGSWGFVRNVREFPEGRVYTRFHEGLDIRPVARDARGIPTDPVKSIASGVVVHVNSSASRSNYGKYVVVRHDWGYGPFYSLYAHLASTSAEIGQQVSPGSVLGILGSTGSGLNNARAHVHLELDIMLSERFDDWMRHFLNSANPHGNCNGLNLSGLDLSEIYLKLQKDPNFNLAKHIHALPQHYRVTVPRTGSGPLPIVKRYRWMGFGNHSKPSKSWEIAFTRSGFIVGIAPSNREVSEPTVTYVRSTRIDHKHYTIGRLTGTGSTATLTSSGERFIALITDEFPTGN